MKGISSHSDLIYDGYTLTPDKPGVPPISHPHPSPSNVWPPWVRAGRACVESLSLILVSVAGRRGRGGAAAPATASLKQGGYKVWDRSRARWSDMRSETRRVCDSVIRGMAHIRSDIMSDIRSVVSCGKFFEKLREKMADLL